MKVDIIKQGMSSIENCVRHVYNQGFEAGRKAERNRGMTNKEAIEKLKILKEDYWDDDGYGRESQLYDDTVLALDMAIKALSQEPTKEE